MASRRKPLASFEFSQYRVRYLGLALSTGVDEAPIHMFCATHGSAGWRFHRSQPLGRSGSGESCRRTQQPIRFLVAVLVTEGDTIAEVLANVEDVFAAVVEICQDRGCSLPAGIFMDDASGPVSVEAVVSVS